MQKSGKRTQQPTNGRPSSKEVVSMPYGIGGAQRNKLGGYRFFGEEKSRSSNFNSEATPSITPDARSNKESTRNEYKAEGGNILMGFSGKGSSKEIEAEPEIAGAFKGKISNIYENIEGLSENESEEELQADTPAFKQKKKQEFSKENGPQNKSRNMIQETMKRKTEKDEDEEERIKQELEKYRKKLNGIKEASKTRESNQKQENKPKQNGENEKPKSQENEQKQEKQNPAFREAKKPIELKNEDAFKKNQTEQKDERNTCDKKDGRYKGRTILSQSQGPLDKEKQQKNTKEVTGTENVIKNQGHFLKKEENIPQKTQEKLLESEKLRISEARLPKKQVKFDENKLDIGKMDAFTLTFQKGGVGSSTQYKFNNQISGNEMTISTNEKSERKKFKEEVEIQRKTPNEIENNVKATQQHQKHLNQKPAFKNANQNGRPSTSDPKTRQESFQKKDRNSVPIASSSPKPLDTKKEGNKPKGRLSLGPNKEVKIEEKGKQAETKEKSEIGRVLRDYEKMSEVLKQKMIEVLRDPKANKQILSLNIELLKGQMDATIKSISSLTSI